MAFSKGIGCAVVSGVGASLDQKRARLQTVQRGWLVGKQVRQVSKQFPVQPGMEDHLCRGSFVGLNELGELTELRQETRFCGVLEAVGLSSSGSPFGSVRVSGLLWAGVNGLGRDTPKDAPIYADLENQTLNLKSGACVGFLKGQEKYGGRWTAHIQVEGHLSPAENRL